MRSRRFVLLVLCALVGVAALPAEAPAGVSQAEYRQRRQQLLEQVQAPVLLFATEEGGVLPEATFWQEPNFYYLSGVTEPSAALLLIPTTEAAALPSEILFLKPRDRARERWNGPRLGPDDPEAPAQTGFARVEPLAALPAQLERTLSVFPTLYKLFPRSGSDGTWTPEGEHVAWLRQAQPGAELHDARAMIGALRQMKSEGEQVLLRTAIDKTLEAHRAAMAALRPGVYEYEVASLMVYTYQRAGCERSGYAPIVGSGFNSTVLHYDANRRQMQAGDVVVIDVGGECDAYTADITRTLPVDGHFTPRQREIYEIVLGAQEAAIKAVKPGMTFARTGPNSLYRIAYDYINTHGKDKHGEPLGKYFIHGLGHHIGLEVHDAGDPYRPLEPGMIITIEPGIYIPEENLGVRIEDDVLVTKDGGVLLSGSLPRTVEDVERAMAAGRAAKP